ncbi:MAG TPA: very short patch repair endonuclease [Rhizomicrobium sp.]|nr:very short patch repair endonuclease [Rhizomicrobium sp.]
MADVLSPEQRRLNMSRIKGKDTKPEKRLRSALHARGWRFRLHRRDLPGSPDVVFNKLKVAIFVDGCFWHGCAMHSVKPQTNSDFWLNKIKKNKVRDRDVSLALRNLGWMVVRIWEHDLRGDMRSAMKIVERALSSRKNRNE